MTPEERAEKIGHDWRMGPKCKSDIAEAIREAVAEDRRQITDKLYDLSEKVREQCGHSEFGQGYIVAIREADDVVRQAEVREILGNTTND